MVAVDEGGDQLLGGLGLLRSAHDLHELEPARAHLVVVHAHARAAQLSDAVDVGAALADDAPHTLARHVHVRRDFPRARLQRIVRVRPRVVRRWLRQRQGLLQRMRRRAGGVVVAKSERAAAVGAIVLLCVRRGGGGSRGGGQRSRHLVDGGGGGVPGGRRGPVCARRVQAQPRDSHLHRLAHLLRLPRHLQQVVARERLRDEPRLVKG
mmetsp:Transcript_12235/g.44633  ORF Transcript_12235/g.44633 Transcript_12235/m.44633 type:complete len:209 (+) Transcript_12235:185-811(+)